MLNAVNVSCDNMRFSQNVLPFTCVENEYRNSHRKYDMCVFTGRSLKQKPVTSPIQVDLKKTQSILQEFYLINILNYGGTDLSIFSSIYLFIHLSIYLYILLLISLSSVSKTGT